MGQYLESGPMNWRIIAPLLCLISASLVAYLAWKIVQNRRTRFREHTIDSIAWRPGFRLTEESRQRFMDDTAEPKTAAHTVSEYILYAAVPIATTLAAMFYKASLTDSQLAAFNILVGVVYFGFMAWTFSRLNTIYRNRKLVRHEPHRIHVEFVQSTVETVSDRSQDTKRWGPGGLTSIQLAILLFVFIIAFTAFTWALKILR